MTAKNLLQKVELFAVGEIDRPDALAARSATRSKCPTVTTPTVTGALI
ncbi:hypothetical protein GPSY_0428 [Paraglaciecola psychrophila 170]|nr:hypothetical protein GPSY_0428 [Paraglaciecola psychrophila 170]